MNFSHPRSARCKRFRSAFTLIELLVVIAIILILVGLLVVAIAGATRSAQRTNTQALMNTMKQAVVRFKSDIGYIPPILGTKISGANPNPAVSEYRRLFDWLGQDRQNIGPGFTGDDIHPDNPNYATEVQYWYSLTSPAEYLIGWANHNEDGFGIVTGASSNNDWDAENPPLGIRNPGPDGIWGATYNGNAASSFAQYGLVANRMLDRAGASAAHGSETVPLPSDQGQVFGPYLELKDPRLIGGINGTDGNGDPIIVFAGEVSDAIFQTLPKVVVDYWGKPIRYYRRPYPPGGLSQSYRSGVDRNNDGNPYNDRVPTLSDFFLLRPWEFKTGTDVNGLADAAGDTGTTAELEAGEFAFFSAGPDKSFDQNRRIDADEFNKDNIVEIGP
ncbi:MAG TPA: type II secretion system protein [Phycisphaerales bacterium]|nr:type II secretion system protein [Phycisphaerales bacterium]